MKLILYSLCVILAISAGLSTLAIGDASSLRDRTPVGTLPERAEPETSVDTRDLTADERMAAMERTIARLVRTVDPHNTRDEMRLENRLRDLESQVQRLEQEIRRLDARR